MRNRKFEDWIAKRWSVSASQIEDMWDGSTYCSDRYHVEIAWAAWCAALGFEQE